MDSVLAEPWIAGCKWPASNAIKTGTGDIHPVRVVYNGSNTLMWILPSITGILGLAFSGTVLAVRWLTK